MTLRKSASALFAALIVSAPFATAASAATTHHPHSTLHHSTRAHPGTHRDGGSAAVDALNQQSLDAARAGNAPMGATPSGTMPSDTTPGGAMH